MTQATRNPLALRSLTLCAATLILSGTAGCGTVTLTGLPGSSLPPVAGPWTTRTVDRNQVSVSVPSNWNAGEPWLSPSSFTDLVASFSNQALSPPCTRAPMSLACGTPLTSLRSGAVLVEVFQNAAPGWTIDSQPGTSTMVSGLSARVAAQGDCAGLGADAGHTEVVALSTRRTTSKLRSARGVRMTPWRPGSWRLSGSPRAADNLMTSQPDDAQRSGWVTFAGFKYQFVAARPDDGYVHVGAGRALCRVTLCDKPARRLWWGSGRVCPDCHRLEPPWQP